MSQIFFTADQHYGHANIIRFCNRPFDSIEEMDRELIRRHNEVVGPKDSVVHAGDFAFKNSQAAQTYLDQLNGRHRFVRGNHDRWMDASVPQILEMKIEKQHLVICHYAMRAWRRSHRGSWQLYGHSHGILEPIGLQWDVGVDNNNFYPVSFDQIKELMETRIQAGEGEKQGPRK